MNTAVSSTQEVSICAVLVLVVWSLCVTVSLVGFVLPYSRPLRVKEAIPPIRAEVIQVELTSDPLPALNPQVQTAALPQPPSLQLPSAPALPALTAVAEPSAVAFALPVEGPVSVVEPAQASFAAAPTVPPDAAPAVARVTTLTYGQGEGRQPAPEYPLRARREGQEGVVNVRFSVGEDGRVLAAEASSPSPWKLLNEAAVRVVRERWRFSAGAARLYEVSIRFQLTR